MTPAQITQPTREQLAETLARVYFGAQEHENAVGSNQPGKAAWRAVADVVLADMQRANQLVIENARLQRQLDGYGRLTEPKAGDSHDRRQMSL